MSDTKTPGKLKQMRFTTPMSCCGQHAMWHMPFMKQSEFSLP